mmetsp:Transcript_37525/g.56648  ORF Transcript_37525/g.56648 Transcript_37525/m.56648 type:complete len:344 (-) Transcript_37525:247-1278(-)
MATEVAEEVPEEVAGEGAQTGAASTLQDFAAPAAPAPLPLATPEASRSASSSKQPPSVAPAEEIDDEDELAVGEVVAINGEEVIPESTATRRKKKRAPGARWNGRYCDLTLKEYREMRWGVDAAFNKVHRKGPSWTMRPSAASLKMDRAASDPLLSLDVMRGFNAAKRVGPSFSMGPQPIVYPPERSQGPGGYNIKSTMDPRGNPLYPKHQGSMMGTSTLLGTDSDGPAPGDYSVDAFEKNARIRRKPAWTCAGREAWLPRTTAPDPGPGEYKFETHTRRGKITPFRWSCATRTEPKIIPGSTSAGHAGPIYDVPGVPGAPGQYASTFKPPEWKFSKEPRGLL